MSMNEIILRKDFKEIIGIKEIKSIGIVMRILWSFPDSNVS